MAHVHELRKMGKAIRAGGVSGTQKKLFVGGEFQQALGRRYAATLNENITKAHYAADVSYATGKQLGSDAGWGKVETKLTPKGVTVNWVGRQIEYLEYGAGAPAVERPYQGSMPSWYKPQAEGHAGGRYWFFRGEKIEGWRPYAPFYKTYLQWKNGKFNKEVYDSFVKFAMRKKAELVPVSKYVSVTIKIG